MPCKKQLVRLSIQDCYRGTGYNMFICFKYYVSNRNAQIDPNNRIFSRITQVTLLNNNYQARRCHHVSCSWNHHLMKTLLVLHRIASLTKYEYFKTWTTRANILQMDTIPLPFDFKCTVIVGLLYWEARNSKNKKLNLKNKHPSLKKKQKKNKTSSWNSNDTKGSTF